MLKVRCRLPWDAERDLGVIRPEGRSVEEHNDIEGKALVESHPHLRPCGKYHGVAVKAGCKKCRECVEVFEEKESPAGEAGQSKVGQ